MIGLITLNEKCAGARSAGNPHAACEAEGTGNGVTEGVDLRLSIPKWPPTAFIGGFSHSTIGGRPPRTPALSTSPGESALRHEMTLRMKSRPPAGAVPRPLTAPPFLRSQKMKPCCPATRRS